MSDIKPYQIFLPEDKIELLQKKLELATFPDELDSADWDYGSPLADVKRLTEAWKTLDFQAWQNKLNSYQNYSTSIQATGFAPLEIHFLHYPSQRANAIPLLFLHGWPGHYTESFKIIEDLRSPSENDPAFHIVVPSLPNFGFSEGPKKKGFALAQYAETCQKLMLKLGYSEFVTQSGDWGFWIARAMGKLYPKNVKASHLNMDWATEPTAESSPALAKEWEEYKAKSLSERDEHAKERKQWFQREGKGYNLLQSTKPQTIAYALNDSPVALLAWIYEKLHDWTHDYSWTDTEILEWVSMYWFSKAGPGAASRIYYETTHTSEDESTLQKGLTHDSMGDYNPEVKIGMTHNPRELEPIPLLWAKGLGELVYQATNTHGGHFYAHEHPEWLIRDMRAMFGPDGGAFGVVEGKSGFD